jgi:uncharacterized protein (UPF0333 family)
MVNMGFTSILALIVIAIFIAVIYVVIHGIKNKNWKQVKSLQSLALLCLLQY